MVALPEHVHCVSAKRKPYYYFHPYGDKKNADRRVWLPGDSRDPTYGEVYLRLSGQTQGSKETQLFTLPALIAKHKGSPELVRKKENTNNINKVHLRFIGDNGAGCVWQSRALGLDCRVKPDQGSDRRGRHAQRPGRTR